MFDVFFCDTLNGMDCYDFDGYGDGGDGRSYGPPKPAEIIHRDCRVARETPKAWFIDTVDNTKGDDGYTVYAGWYPKSRCTFKAGRIHIPDWLVRRKTRGETLPDILDGFDDIN